MKVWINFYVPKSRYDLKHKKISENQSIFRTKFIKLFLSTYEVNLDGIQHMSSLPNVEELIGNSH